MIGILDTPNNCEFNLLVGRNSPTSYKSPYGLNQVPIQTNEIKKIVLRAHPTDAMLMGIQFFDKKGTKTYESAWKTAFTNTSFTSHETVLAEGERIAGFKSRKQSDTHALHYDFQFIIGRME